MSKLDLTADQVLTTTRAVRKRLDFDRPVEMDVVRECLEIALQAPSGSNAQGWHFVIDHRRRAKRRAIGDFYKPGVHRPTATCRCPRMPSPSGERAPRRKQMNRVVSSAEYLGENMGRAPVAASFPASKGRVDGVTGQTSRVSRTPSFYGSDPAGSCGASCSPRASRGLGTSWTTLHLMFEQAGGRAASTSPTTR